MRALDLQQRPVGNRLTAFSALLVLLTGLGWLAAPPASGTAAGILVTVPALESALDSVSCVTAEMCTAVGYDGSMALIETWRGSVSSIVPSPARGTDSALNGVSCVSVRQCETVGSYTSGSLSRTLAESWNGSAW